jgi:hypothetical protein
VTIASGFTAIDRQLGVDVEEFALSREETVLRMSAIDIRHKLYTSFSPRASLVNRCLP